MTVHLPDTINQYLKSVIALTTAWKDNITAFTPKNDDGEVTKGLKARLRTGASSDYSKLLHRLNSYHEVRHH